MIGAVDGRLTFAEIFVVSVPVLQMLSESTR